MNMILSRYRMVLFLFAFTIITLFGLSLTPRPVSAAGGSVDAWTVETVLKEGDTEVDSTEASTYTMELHYHKVTEDAGGVVYQPGEIELIMDFTQKLYDDQSVFDEGKFPTGFKLAAGYEDTWNVTYDFNKNAHVFTNNRVIDGEQALSGSIKVNGGQYNQSGYFGDGFRYEGDIGSFVVINGSSKESETKHVTHVNSLMKLTTQKDAVKGKLSLEDLAFITTLTDAEKQSYLWIPWEVQVYNYSGLKPDSFTIRDEAGNGAVKLFREDGTEVNAVDAGTEFTWEAYPGIPRSDGLRWYSERIYVAYYMSVADDDYVWNVTHTTAHKEGFPDSPEATASDDANPVEYKPVVDGEFELQHTVGGGFGNSREVTDSDDHFPRYLHESYMYYNPKKDDTYFDFGSDLEESQEGVDITEGRQILSVSVNSYWSMWEEAGYEKYQLWVKDRGSDDYRLYTEKDIDPDYSRQEVEFEDCIITEFYVRYLGINQGVTLKTSIEYAVATEESDTILEALKTSSPSITTYTYLRALDDNGVNSLIDSKPYKDKDILIKKDLSWGQGDLYRYSGKPSFNGARLSAYALTSWTNVPDGFGERNVIVDNLVRPYVSFTSARADTEYRYLDSFDIVYSFPKELGKPYWDYYLSYSNKLVLKNGVTLEGAAEVRAFLEAHLSGQSFIEDYSSTMSAYVLSYNIDEDLIADSINSPLDILMRSVDISNFESLFDVKFYHTVTPSKARAIYRSYPLKSYPVDGSIVFNKWNYQNAKEDPVIGLRGGEDTNDINRNGLSTEIRATDSRTRGFSIPNSSNTRSLLQTVTKDGVNMGYRTDIDPNQEYGYHADFSTGGDAVASMSVLYNLENYDMDWKGLLNALEMKTTGDIYNNQNKLYYSEDRNEPLPSQGGTWKEVTGSEDPKTVGSLMLAILPVDASSPIIDAATDVGFDVSLIAPENADGFTRNGMQIEWNNFNTNTLTPDPKTRSLFSNRVVLGNSDVPSYFVSYVFQSKVPSLTLPEKIVNMTPDDPNAYPNKTKIDVPYVMYQPVQDGNVCWVFNGWDKDTKTINGADIQFIGLWEQKVGYSVAYQFVSGTPGKELPESVLELLPLDNNIYTTIGESVNAIEPTKTVVPDGPGSWQFVEYDKESLLINETENLFIGTWVYNDIPVTGIQASVGDWIVTTLLMTTAIGIVLLMTRKSKLLKYLSNIKK